MKPSNHLFRIVAPLLLLALFSYCEDSNDPFPKAILDDSLDVLVFEYTTQMPTQISGTSLMDSIASLDLQARERLILAMVKNGHIPDHLRAPVAIEHEQMVGDSLYSITFYVSPDYLSLGTDEDFARIPMSPILAQKVMDEINAVLPTRKMVNLIWQAAALKLEPEPIPPSPAMTTVPVFRQHESLVDAQVLKRGGSHDLGVLIAGHKKDVVLSNRIWDNLKRVVIYGWHYLNGSPIQPLYSGHVNWYADYSHGIRPVLSKCEVNGQIMDIQDVLTDKDLYKLLSDESGTMTLTRYDTSSVNYP
ncbi:MAG: hypothetical protein K9M49_05625 [Candidatus Marinimicrobia bacterium]|nr:hypothetical protein [Candidatus Neomarinimicrobiota bacterium]MCF7904617.1 hypothetical protein [Candidatus Neomarinimicrobiota bacterium]